MNTELPPQRLDSEKEEASENAVPIGVRNKDGWPVIGTVVGSTSTGKFTFILKGLRDRGGSITQAKLGDIVACVLEVPGVGAGTRDVRVWGRITSIDRFNPFFPAEAAQELANENVDFLDTVLSNSRDHLEAEVLILGITATDNLSDLELSPLTYPVKPACDVLYPPPDNIKRLLIGKQENKAPLRIGTLIARGDVDVNLTAEDIVSRHLAILAMTGGGKTVAARRILRELIDLGYPVIIFDPHGDYLGLYENKTKFPQTKVQILYPKITIERDNVDVIRDLIDKMGSRMTDPQQQFYIYLLGACEPRRGGTAIDFIEDLIGFSESINRRKMNKEDVSDELRETRPATINVVIRNLTFVLNALKQMEANNERLRQRFPTFEFIEMPDPKHDPENIIRPGLLSIFYLAGYDHLAQSAIVSIVLESLFEHRLTLSNRIAPFQAVIEEAHNFIPSRSEGLGETPSLVTIRKVITEGRKFGTGLILISQRPSRLDETTLAQCNSFLVLRLVNPRDKSFVRSVMENLSESDANILQTFGPGQGLVSGQAVRFPLLVKIDFDEDLLSQAIGDEQFIQQAQNWRPSETQKRKQDNETTISKNFADDKASSRAVRRGRSKRKLKKGGIQVKGF